MLDCLILGDSIAKGISDIRTECVAYTKVGINSYNWNNKYLTGNLSAKTVIISLGSNDSNDRKTRDELFTLRQNVKADKVYWILPANKSTMREAVTLVAFEFNDIVLPIPQLSTDKVHPTSKGYSELAKMTRN
jgi:lysophospholipase L1-like esterase